MYTDSHHAALAENSPQPEAATARPPLSPVFYLPVTRLSVSAYAELTGQSVRAVQQQISRGKLPVSEAATKERQINMLFIFLQDYKEAMSRLYPQHEVFN